MVRREPVHGMIWPLDERDAIRRERVLEAELRQLAVRIVDAIKVEVLDRRSALVRLAKDEGRTAHWRVRAVQCRHDGAHERRLACAERTEQRDDVSGDERCGEAAREALECRKAVEDVFL